MNSLKRLIRTLWGTALAGSLLLTPACQPSLPLLDRIQQEGELIVATQEGPTTYFRELDQETGFEFELARAYANYLGVDLKIRTYQDLGDLLAAVERGEVHMAAAGLTVTPERSRRFRFSSPYQQITQQLIYHSDRTRPADISALAGKKLLVIANSSHSENLSRLQPQYPELRWEETANTSALALLNMVNDGQVDYAVLDSNVFNTYRSVFPELRGAFTLGEPEPLAWAFSASSDPSLFTAAEMFFNQVAETGALEELRIRFFGHREFDYVGARTFITHLDSRLVKYEDDYKAVARELGLDWRLLAAIGYQESLWNANAISPTGVRGLMMLTRRTAREMDVSNRRDPVQSIRGGSRYFSKLYQRLPDSIAEPHRTWFTLAAYNVGYGHLMDARRLARKDNMNPDNWFDVRQKLPLLRHREHYAGTRHGFARAGAQSVIYVRNIRRYYEALVWATERDQHRYSPRPQSLMAMRESLVH